MSREGPGQIVVREALASEHEEAGRITAEAYREFVGPTDHAWHEYLEAIADVGGRADRTTIRNCSPRKRTSGCSVCSPGPDVEAWHGP